MYCRYCGESIREEATICPHCGCAVGGRRAPKIAVPDECHGGYGSKIGLGVVLCLFLGLIGLIIGLCLYPSYTYERSTFVRGWLTTFLVCLGIVLVLFLIVAILIGGIAASF